MQLPFHEMLSGTTDPTLGLLSYVRERRTLHSKQNNFITMSHLKARSPAGAAANTANGAGHHNRTQSQLSALGEAVERYCLSQYDRNEMVAAPLGEDFTTWQFFADTQYDSAGFNLKRPNPQSLVTWVAAQDFVSGAHIDVPSSLIYLPYDPVPGELTLDVQMSNGTACYSMPDEAMIRAILELVERDSYALFWETQSKLTKIEVPASMPAKSRCPAIEDGFELHLYDLTTDLKIPCVLAIAALTSDLTKFGVGTAAGTHPEHALEHAVREAIMTLESVAIKVIETKDLSHEGIKKELFENPEYLLHSLYYVGTTWCDSFPVLQETDAITASSWIDQNQPDASLSRADILRRALQKAGIRLYIKDITSRDMEQIGLSVVRAVSPDLLRQSLGTRFRHLGSRRLFEAPAKAGWKPQLKCFDEIFAHQAPCP